MHGRPCGQRCLRRAVSQRSRSPCRRWAINLPQPGQGSRSAIGAHRSAKLCIKAAQHFGSFRSRGGSPINEEGQARPRPTVGRGLVREVSYLHADEEAALVEYAARKKVSKAEVIRQALRAFLGVED